MTKTVGYDYHLSDERVNETRKDPDSRPLGSYHQGETQPSFHQQPTQPLFRSRKLRPRVSHRPDVDNPSRHRISRIAYANVSDGACRPIAAAVVEAEGSFVAIPVVHADEVAGAALEAEAIVVRLILWSGLAEGE